MSGQVSEATQRPTETMVRDSLYIGGSWTSPDGAGRIEVVDPTTERMAGEIPEGTAADVDRAVEAARAGFEVWSRTPLEERLDAVGKIADGIEERGDELAALISTELGMPLKQSRRIQVGLSTTDLKFTIRAAAEFPWEEEVRNSVVVRESIGVVGAITPWNFPLHQLCAKLAPALVAGCSVVAKPSEVTPLNAFVLAEIIDDLDLPEGVFNLVSGYGPEVGEAIAAHEGVDMLSFTGSTRAGKLVGRAALDNMKRVTLELGGKSASVILDDADLETAIPASVLGCFLNAGQTCSAHTRLLIPASRLAEVEELAAGKAGSITPTDPFAEGSRMGPLVSAAQRDRVRGYIEKGQTEGAKLLVGGTAPPKGSESGFFVRPTVFSEATPDMTIAQEEIFGPVLTIIPYRDEDEAAEIANGTIYGLDGGVWSADLDRARAFARRMRAGQVQINGAAYNPMAPFGGYKQSGSGRELGEFGLHEFLEIKSIQV